MAENVIDHLVEDHDRVRQLFADFDDADTEQRKEIFGTLVEELAKHESAEEEVLYPVLRKEVDGGDELADARISEEEEAEQVLAELEGLGVDHPEFEGKFIALRDDVLAHAEAEETEVFPPLRQALSTDRLEELGTWVERAEATAPTHPHPGAPNTTPGIYAAGPVAAMFDRARDALRDTSN